MPIETDLRCWGLISAAWPRTKILGLLFDRYKEILKASDIQFDEHLCRRNGPLTLTLAMVTA